MACWNSLPAEIRLIVLGELLAQKTHLASYATVCKEWQAIIEKENFRRLKLRASCLDDFEQIISHRVRGLVKHVWLNIELHPYTCQICHRTESGSRNLHNITIISRAISKLFSILSTWNHPGGLTLELSTQSPSDSEHWFKDCYFGAQENEIETSKLHDPKHGWIDGQQVTSPPPYAILRLYERATLILNAQRKLPEVCAVTRFVLRRQCRRQFDLGILQLLLNRFPLLECMVYEPWRSWDRIEKRRKYDEECKNMIDARLPKGLRRISVFQDFNEDYISSIQEASIRQLDPVRIGNPAVGAAFAYKSLDLEQLSVSFMIDARHFFQARQSQWTWNQLESLVLTSPGLTRTTNCEKISDLLQDAGTAALCMPKLHTMALWNGGKGEAFGFIYREMGCKYPSITLKSTWEVKLEPRVIQAWEKVVSKDSPYELRVEEQLLSSNIKSHGDAIHQLGLPSGVIDPVSLWQIQRECS